MIYINITGNSALAHTAFITGYTLEDNLLLFIGLTLILKSQIFNKNLIFRLFMSQLHQSKWQGIAIRL